VSHIGQLWIGTLLFFQRGVGADWFERHAALRAASRSLSSDLGVKRLSRRKGACYLLD
jgi:hypothetical protein